MSGPPRYILATSGPLDGTPYVEWYAPCKDHAPTRMLPRFAVGPRIHQPWRFRLPKNIATGALINVRNEVSMELFYNPRGS